MDTWDRSPFASTPDELEVEEAIRALERVVQSDGIGNSTRVSLRLALEALRADRR
jgi:hypothetical protein